MGNKLGRRRQAVDEKYTKPQGLHQHNDVDPKKLRKLILNSKLAPCYPGHDDCGCDLEECPICFLYYPSLNRSTCCMKGICTECFLQMKTPNSPRPTQCPFCKTSNYAVEYRGVKTKEEKGLEQIEEQRVIEANIRTRQQELRDEEASMLKQREISCSRSTRGPNEVHCCSTKESEELVAYHDSGAASAIRLPTRQRENSEDEFELEFEDVLVMEAIWLSIQENSSRQDPRSTDATAHAEECKVDDPCSLLARGPLSGSSCPSGGLARDMTSLAVTEHQRMSGDMSTNDMPGCSRRYLNQEELESSDGQLAMTGGDAGEWPVGTGYGRCDELGNALRSAAPVTGAIIPESFEEQMMLAMAVSLAEA